MSDNLANISMSHRGAPPRAANKNFRFTLFQWPPHRAKRKWLLPLDHIESTVIMKEQQERKQKQIQIQQLQDHRPSRREISHREKIKIRTQNQITREAHILLLLLMALVSDASLSSETPSTLSRVQVQPQIAHNSSQNQRLSSQDLSIEINKQPKSTQLLLNDTTSTSTTTTTTTTTTSNLFKQEDQFKFHYSDGINISPQASTNNQIVSPNPAHSKPNHQTNVFRYQTSASRTFTQYRPPTIRQIHNNNRPRTQERHSNRHWQPVRHQFESRRARNRIGLRRSRPRIRKRVLLCEKTLISLDYIPKQRMQHQSHDYLSNSDDNSNHAINTNALNSLDLDEYSSEHEPEPEPRIIETSNSPNTNNSNDNIIIENDDLESAASLNQYNYDTDEADWLLPDEQQLLLCNMWDLEKGLLNRKPPEALLAQAIKTDFNTVREAIKRCRLLSERSIHLYEDHEYRDSGEPVISTEDMVSMFSIKRGLIPGTKWCGLGDIANNYNDLGSKSRIDICCRAHDHCPIRLKPFRNDYGLLNIALYTKSHCECDADFYRCLRDVRTKTADMLGNLYFNVMKLQCLKQEPLKMCRQLRTLPLGFERCIKYEQSVNKTVFRFSAPPFPY